MFVQTAWVDVRGDESALSPVNGIILPGQSTITVAMAEGALNVPPTAVGWNVYVSATDTGLTLQNQGPLQIGTTWALPAGGLQEGAAPINGQKPDYMIALSRQILRG
jgi:hypothetical protein